MEHGVRVWLSSVGKHTVNNKQYPSWYFSMIWAIGCCGALIIGYVTAMDGGVSLIPNISWRYYSRIGKEDYITFVTVLLPAYHFFMSLVPIANVDFFNIKRFGLRVFTITTGIMLFASGIVNGYVINHFYESGPCYKCLFVVVGRLLLHTAFGFVIHDLPIYMFEMVHVSYRGILIVSFQLMIAMGVFLSNLVCYGAHTMLEASLGWKISFFLVAVPASIISIGSFLLPDTPKFMVEQGETKKARVTLISIRGTSDVDEEYSDLLQLPPHSNGEKKEASKINNSNEPYFMMALAIALLQQLTGAPVIVFYGPVVFKAIGFDTSASLMVSFLVGGVNVVATFFLIIFGDRKPTRFKLIAGGVLIFVCQITIGILVLISTEKYANFIIVALCIYCSCYVWSWGSLGLVPSEIFRALGVPLETQYSHSATTKLISDTIILQVFPHMLYRLHLTIFFVLSSVIVLIIAVVYFLPETADVPVEEISQVWKQHWFWREYLRAETDDVSRSINNV